LDARLAQTRGGGNAGRVKAEPRDSNPVDVPAETCPANVSGEYWRWCPQCGHELHNEKCKLRCQRCHYFMSCSDFD
jgi:hypothetical protein